ncbi:MAG TPA: hypothetical protein VK150_03200 [Geothrix sp.]|nr:hypothetical protein [Geothrix sp.]
MRAFAFCLLPCLLAAQGPGTAAEPGPSSGSAFATTLGTDPLAQIRLTPPGCWDGLLLSGSLQPPKQGRREGSGATVEVWDLLPVETTRSAAFAVYLESLRKRLSKALELPPPNHGTLELGDFMQSDPTQPQKLDLTKVKSMQERYNQLPPNGSPVKPGRP